MTHSHGFYQRQRARATVIVTFQFEAEVKAHSDLCLKGTAASSNAKDLGLCLGRQVATSPKYVLLCP